MRIENNHTVSVIIPTLNRLALLKKALKSVYEQTYTNIEIIVIDVCSTDGTAEYLKTESEAKNIKVYTSTIPLKGGEARNIGIKNATGSLIAFLDDDDEWLPQKLEKQVPLFNNPEIGMVYTGATLVNVDYNLTYDVSPKIEGYIFEELLIENRIGTTTSVAILAKIAKENLFDEQLPARQDYDMWLRVAKHHKIAGVHSPCTLVYSRNNLHRVTSNIDNYVIAVEMINNKYRADIDALSNGKQIQRKSEQLFFLASQAFKANNISLAQKYYFKSMLIKFNVKAAGSLIASFFGSKALIYMRKLKG